VQLLGGGGGANKKYKYFENEYFGALNTENK
jgi:hypothetical protein